MQVMTTRSHGARIYKCNVIENLRAPTEHVARIQTLNIKFFVVVLML